MKDDGVDYEMKFWYFKGTNCHVEEIATDIIYKNTDYCNMKIVSKSKTTTYNFALIKDASSQFIQPIANITYKCTSMILENLAEPEWISVPCQDKILTDIVCVRELDLKQNETTNFAQIDVNLKLTLFLCMNDEFISSSRQCDGIKDCTGGEDEANCLCYINGVTISDSHYCRNVCQDPQCSCADLFLSNNKPGCHKYEEHYVNDNKVIKEVVHNEGKKENDNLFNCSNGKLIRVKQVNDLIPDCQSNIDEPILYSLLKNNSFNVPNNLPKDQY